MGSFWDTAISERVVFRFYIHIDKLWYSHPWARVAREIGVGLDNAGPKLLRKWVGIINMVLETVHLYYDHERIE